MVGLYNTFGNHGYWNRFEAISVLGVLSMLCIVAFFLVIHKIVNKDFLRVPINKGSNFKQYTFAFEETHFNVKEITIRTRLIIYCMSALLLVTPLYKLIPSLDTYMWSWVLW